MIKELREIGLEAVAASQKRMMSVSEMERILDASRKYQVSVNEEERGKKINLAINRYGQSKWGLINGITEVAQNHELDNRVLYETWAGNILQLVA